MIKLNDIPTTELVETYNICADRLGMSQVKKFENRQTAERRTAFALSQILPEKRPGRFAEHLTREETHAQNLADPDTKAMMQMNGGIAPSVPEPEQTERDIVEEDRMKALETPAPSPEKPAPQPAASAPASSGRRDSERWREPKSKKPQTIAYRPRAKSMQAEMYRLLTQEGGITPEDFLVEMGKKGSRDCAGKPWMVWGAMSYLFCAQKGYGLTFDGQKIKLVVPSDERDAPPKNGVK